MKKILIFSSLLIFLVSAFWVSAHVLLRAKAPAWIEQLVEKRAGLRVHIKAVRAYYFTALELRNIELEKPFEIEIPKLVVSLHASVFPIQIELTNPKVHIHVPKKSSVHSPVPPVPIPIEIKMVNGDVIVSDDKWVWASRRVEGTARLSALVYDVYLRGFSDETGAFEGQAALDNRLNQPWRASIVAPSIKLERLNAAFPTLLKKGSSVSGTVRAQVQMSGAWLTNKVLQDWNVDIAAKNVRWKSGEAHVVGPLRGHALLNPHGVENININLHQANLTGKIPTAWSTPRLDLTLRVPEGTPIKETLNSLGWDSIESALSGTAGGIAQVRGNPSNPQISGSFNAEPDLGPVRWPLIQGNFSYDNHLLRAEADTLSGHAKLAGDFSGRKSKLQWTLADVSFGQLAGFNGWKNVKGQLSANAELALSEDGPSSVGAFQIRNLQWGRIKTPSLSKGNFSLSDHKIQLHTVEHNLDVMITRADQDWKVEQARVVLNNASNAEVSGVIHGADKTCSLEFKAQEIPSDVWPPVVERYPNIAGVINLRGTHEGSCAAGSTQMSVDFSKIQFAPGLKSWDGEARIQGQAHDWIVDDFHVTSGYRGRAEWTSKDGPHLHVSAEIANADPQFLFDLFRSTLVANGKLNGNTDLTWNGRDIVGVSTAAWSEGQWNRFAFDRLNTVMHFAKNKVSFDDVSLVRNGQALRGHADLDRSGKIWSVSADLQFQNWGNKFAILNGETAVNGSLALNPSSLDLRFTTPFLELNNVPLEDMKAAAHYHDSVWRLTADAENFVNVDLRGDVSKETIAGTVVAKQLDLASYLPRLLPNLHEIPAGKADIALTLKGTIDNPQAHFSLKSDDILWREEHVAPSFDAVYRDGFIQFENAHLSVRNGGTISVSGRYLTTSVIPVYTLTGQGRSLSLQSVIHLIHIPLRWNGHLNGTFEVSGSSSGHTNGSITFDGTHEGFAAFEDGGKLIGTISGVDGEWDFSNVRVTAGDGYVNTLPGSKIYVQKDGSATMRVGADVRNIRLGLMSFFGGVEMTGSWEKQPSTDTVSEPILSTNLEIFARSLWVNHYVLDGNITRLTINKGELEFSPIPGSGQQMSGLLHYEKFPTVRVENFRLMDKGQEKIFLNGFVGADKWDFDLRAHQVSTDILRSLVNSDINLEGSLDATVKGLGTPKNPDLAGHMICHDGKVGFLPLDSAECDIHYQDHYMSITKLMATRKNGYVISGNARFYAGSDDTHDFDPDIDLQVDKGDLAFIRDVIPSVNRSHGVFSGHIRMLKKSWGTSIAGFFNADKVSLSTTHIPDLDRGAFKVTLDKNRLHIDEAKARLGSGELHLSGYVDFAGGVPSFYNLALQTHGEDGVKVRVPELSISPGPVLEKIGLFRNHFAGASQGEPLVNVILKGPADGPLLAGVVTLENTVFTYPPSNKRPVDTETSEIGRWMRRFLASLQWDLSVVAGRRTWYQNELVDANIHGDLQFKGYTHDLNIQGSVHTEQGALVYSGNEFQIRTANLEIVNEAPLLNDPSTKQTLVYLKATADRDVFYTDNVGNGTEDTIVMEVDRSLLGEVQPRFYSKNNPSLSPEKALQLALGLPLSTPVDTDNLLPDQRAASNANKGQDVDAGLRLGLIQLLDSSLASPLARAIARNTGLVDYIRVSFQEKDKYEETDPLRTTSTDPNSTITQNEFLKYAKGTKVKFGKGFSDRLFADYSFRVDEYQNQVDLRHEIELSYRVHRNLFLRGTTELDREQVLGRPPDRRAVLENQWRFGLPRRRILDPDNPSNPSQKPS